MADTKSTRWQRDPPEARALGVAASLVGLGLLSLYPLAAAGVAPGGRLLPYYGVPTFIHPFVVFCSAVAGPVFLT